MSTTETSLRERAAQMHAARERVNVAQHEAAIAAEQERRVSEMRRDAAEQLEGLYNDELEHDVDEFGNVLLHVGDGILLGYRAGHSTGEWGWRDGRFYLATPPCQECGFVEWGYDEIGGRHKGANETLADLGMALEKGVQHVCRDEDGEPIGGPKPATRLTAEQKVEVELSRAEGIIYGGDGFVDPAAAATLALAKAVMLTRDAIYWHGGER